jgi:hypothetical protein
VVAQARLLIGRDQALKTLLARRQTAGRGTAA